MDARMRSRVSAGFFVFCIGYLLTADPAMAGCAPAGNYRSDTIVCSDIDSVGVQASHGADLITVLPEAAVDVQLFAPSHEASAIDAGSGDDVVENDGRVAVTVNPTDAGIAGSSGTAGSETCEGSDRHRKRNAAIGIAGGRGDDTIANRGSVEAHNTAAVENCRRPQSSRRSKDRASGAESIGIQGDDGDDQIDNSGDVIVTASAISDGQEVSAIGISGGDGNDEIVNGGSVVVTASPAQDNSVLFPMSSGSPSSRGGRSTASAEAIGIDAGEGKDTITNDGTVTVNATASVNGVSPSLTLAGGDDVDASTSVGSIATGISAGGGRDHVTNNGALSVNSTAEVDNVAVEANLIDLSHADTSTTVRSVATGIGGGMSSDKIAVGDTGTVDATAVSRSRSVSVEANLIDSAVSDATLVVDSRATGIDTGTGHNRVENAGSVKATATSEVRDVGVNVSFIDATLAEGRGSDLSTTLNSTAVGIDSSEGKDVIDVAGTGSIQATAASDAHSVGVSVASEGVPGPTVTLFKEGGLAGVGIASNSDATGIAAGKNFDDVTAEGSVTAKATSTARQESINVGVAVLEFHVPTPGIVLGSAGTRADADATGIAADSGDDKIINKAHVDVDADATAAATTVSVNVAELSFDLAEDFPSLPPFGASLVVAHTATQANANAVGIDGGTGDDFIKNTNAVEANANATGGSTSASATLDVKYKEGENFFAADAVGARSTTTVNATAIGVDAGSDNNRIENAGRVATGASADANTVSVSVVASGTLQGNGGALNLAATDTSTTGTATATGIQGGADRDRITNSGTVEAISSTDVDGVNVGVSASVADKGLVAGVSLARSVSEASATSVGIDGGGGGDDEIQSTGTVTSNATADAGSVAITVNIDGTTRGVAGGAALIDARTTATANATGVRSGGSLDYGESGDDGSADHYGHRGDAPETKGGTINVDAQAHTHSVGVSAEIAVAEKGVAVGSTLANTSANATATAKGVEADGEDNGIVNRGAINVRSGAGSTAVSASLTVAGTTGGLGAGAALTDSSVIVNSNATGIDAGGGDDYVTNSGSITFNQAGSNATAVSVSAAGFVAQSGVAIGAALGRTEANATTNATAIDGGSGGDKLINTGAIAMGGVNAHADAVGVSLGVGISQTGLGVSGALVDGDSIASVSAKVINGGSGDDRLVNTGTVALRHGVADADAVSVAANVTGVETGVALGGALLDADATANMTAAGISGGSGDDGLINKGSITVEDMKANSDAVGVSASLTVAGNGVAATGAFALTGSKANADAKGIDGGDGKDFVYGGGESEVTLRGVKSEADAVSVSVGLSGGDAGLFIGAGLADASGNADTVATAIDGGARNDAVVNKGTITVDDVTSDAHATGVTVGAAGANAGVAAGVSIANTSGMAATHAKGIDGGSGNDVVWNDNAVTLQQVKSHADAVSVGVSLGVTIAGGVAGGISLSDAGANATTDAVGIDGGSGKDKILNTAELTLDGVEANTNAAGVSVELGVTNAGVAIGGALVDTRTRSNVIAKAIDGGSGDDFLANAGDVVLRGVKTNAGATSVGVTVNGAIEGGVAGGVSLTDASSHANTVAIGMNGGSGDDKLYNKGTIRAENVEANTNAAGVSVSAQASFAGIAGGAAIADTSGVANTTVKGVDGGKGNDALRNDGTVNVAGNSKAGALSLGISVSGTIGIAGGAEITNADMTAETTATGLDGGRGRDAIVNTKDVTATARAETDSKAISVGVSVGVGGDASLASATTTATATATGINGGGADVPKRRRHHDRYGMRERHRDDRHYRDDRRDRNYKQKRRRDRDDKGDEIFNDGSVVANATSIGRGTSVGGNLFGFALGELTSTSTAVAAGIQTGDAKDKVQSDGTVDANANATASGLSVAVSLGGKAMGDVSTTADASAVGIATGGGRDEIENTGTITIDARGNASAKGVSVGRIGVAEADASVTALATATGIDGGDDDDKIVNRGSIIASAGTPTDGGGSASCPANAAGTCARVSAVSVNLIGAGFLDATTEARSTAIGIGGGIGKDRIDSSGTVNANARAKTVAGGVNVNIAGAALSDAHTTAAADATGIDGGDGRDVIRAAGTVGAKSSSHIIVSNFGFSLAGVADFDATLDASARGTAIDGGAGRDNVLNGAALTARATATTSTGGDSVVIFGASGSGSRSGALADAAGIRGGMNSDFIGNRGDIDARAKTNLSLDNSSFSLAGTAGAGGQLTATTNSTGIAGDEGHDIIASDGGIVVDAASTVNAGSGSTVVFGSNGSGATAGAVTDAKGIDGGTENDLILNSGKIATGSTATLTLTGGSFAFGGSGGVGGKLTATTRASAIAGGAGADVIKNDGELHVTTVATLHSSGKSKVVFGSSGASSSAGSDVETNGVDGGDDDDFIVNAGKIVIDSRARLTLSGSSYSFGGGAAVNGRLRSTIGSAGIRGGTGDDFIANLDDVSVSGDASVSASGKARVDFGDSSATGDVLSNVLVSGIDGGEGDDWVVNAGTLTSVVTSNANMSHDSDTGFLYGDGDSRAKARSVLDGRGIDVGEGDNKVLNKGTVAIDLFGASTANSDSDGGDVFDGDAFARSDSTVTASATGIRAGTGDDWIDNKGSVDIKTWRRFETEIFPGLPPLVVELATGANADADADGDGIDGDGKIRSFATTHLTVAGIDAGSGMNHVENSGTMSIDARARARATGSVDADAGGSTSATRDAKIFAHAYGIRTGGDDDHVVNSGTITVTTRADNNSGSRDITASATGIETGAGDDTIINEGTITATRIVNGSGSRGTAINAGAGDDIVKLLDGSVTNGNIDLGSGNDMLSLEGTPIINGSFISAFSELSLEFNNSGSYAGGLPGASAIKNGEGTFNLSLLNQMEHIEVNKGTLKLNNDYEFLANGLFQAKVYGDGSNGRFYVNGEAGLNGKMMIVRGGGAYRDGTKFDVFKSSEDIETGTAFNDVELPEATRLLKFDTKQTADAVQVTASVESFTSVAKGANQMAIAENLDRILPTVTGDLNQAMGEVQALPDAQFATAFASLSPESYALHSSAALSTANQYAGVLQDRMATLRTNQLARSTLDHRPVRLAYNGNSVADVAGGGELSGRTAGLWLRAFGQKGDRDPDNGANGFEYDLSGITIGLDRRFSDRVSGGLSLATASSNVKVDNDMSDGDVDSRFLSAYAGYFDNRLYVNGTLSFGRNDYDTRRNMVVGMVTTPLASNHKGDVTAASIGAGRYYPLGQWWMDPFAYLQYTRIEEDGFTENGSGAGLIVASRSTSALVSTVGIRFSRIIESRNGGAWIPEASFAWLHDYSDDDQTINASYVDAPDAAFSVRGQPIERNGASVGLGIGYRTADGFSSLLKYSGEFRNNFDAHGVVGEVRWEF